MSQVSEEIRTRVRAAANHQWGYCLAWTDNGAYISGRTASGRATVLALQLNNPYAVTVRQAWISAGWHPPIEDEDV